MPDSTSSQKNSRPNSELWSSDGEPLFRFENADLKELRDLLGNKLKGALPRLHLAAAVYQTTRDYQSTRKTTSARIARKQLARLDAVLRQVEEIDAALSLDANLILERACFDQNAPLASFGETTARQALSAAVHACAQVRARLNTTSGKRVGRSYDDAMWLLAHGVGRALTAVGEPLSKGRNGLLGSVLTVVCHAVEPQRKREELFPYLKVVADVARMVNPGLPKVPGGRPRRKTK